MQGPGTHHPHRTSGQGLINKAMTIEGRTAGQGNPLEGHKHITWLYLARIVGDAPHRYRRRNLAPQAK